MSDEQKHQDPHQAEKEDAAAQLSAIDMISQADGVRQDPPLRRGHAPRLRQDGLREPRPERHDRPGRGRETGGSGDRGQGSAGRQGRHRRRPPTNSRATSGGSSGRASPPTAFHTWGANLVKHAFELATFAEGRRHPDHGSGHGPRIGPHRHAAPRHPARPPEGGGHPDAEQVDGNAEYDGGGQGREDRQEAINQMNRLASFYEVSETYLAKQQAPTFESMPDVGVPKPDPSYGYEYPANEGQGASRARCRA